MNLYLRNQHEKRRPLPIKLAFSMSHCKNYEELLKILKVNIPVKLGKHSSIKIANIPVNEEF